MMECLSKSDCLMLKKHMKTLGKLQLKRFFPNEFNISYRQLQFNSIQTPRSSTRLPTTQSTLLTRMAVFHHQLLFLFVPLLENVSYGTNKFPNLRFQSATCSSLQHVRPNSFGSQLCYQVDVNTLKNQIDLQKLMSHGLLFLMDYNTIRMRPDFKNLVGTSPVENIADEEDD